MYSQTSARPLRGSASSPGVPAIRGSPLTIERFHAGREAEAVPPRGHARPTLRAVLYGLAGVLFLCVATPYTDLVLRGSWLAHNCLPTGALCLFLLLVTLWNRLLRWLAPGGALSRAELLLVYTMMLVAAGIPSVGFTQPLLGLIVAPAYYASDSNEWARRLYPLIPPWLRVQDIEAAR